MKWSPLQKRWIVGAFFCAALSITTAFLLDAFLAYWVKPISLNAGSIVLSERSLQTLDNAEGTISIASIFPKDASLALPTGQLLRAFESAAKDFKHMELSVTYVDPMVDVANANTLMAKGAEGVGVLFYQAGRSVFIPEVDLCGTQETFDPIAAEEAITAAIARLFRAEEIRVGWVVNHGEPDFSSVDRSGYSGIENALQLEGFTLEPIIIDSTIVGQAVPEDIRILMVVDPHYAYSMDECIALMEWVERGGRLFVALPTQGDCGLSPLLERWGIGVSTQSISPLRTVSGGAGLTDIFSSTHKITQNFLPGVTMTFVAPRSVLLSPAETVSSEVLVEMKQAQSQGQLTLPIMVAAERGGDVAADIVPTLGRVVVVGDATFFTNAYTLNRATANRDLLINTMRWLADVSENNADGASNVLSIGQDSQQWLKDFLLLAVVFPTCFVIFAWLIFRRHR
ncbi:MAG: Gldg family protein [bacterium]|nr:Gldg family protein [bacterium]